MERWAVLTGATAGIGYEFAKLFAAEGFSLVLVARDRLRLDRVASELQQHQISVEVVAQDLSAPNAASVVFQSATGKPVSVLVNNAGFGAQESFASSSVENELAMMRTNMDAVVHLTHLFLQPMLARAGGRILNVASTAAFQPGPFTNVYYATKAFVFSFSVALAEELKDSGVTVTTLCPGYTETEFHERAHIKRSGYMVRMMNAAIVARAGYDGMMRGKGVVIPGLMNKVTAAISRRLPASLSAKIVRRINSR